MILAQITNNVDPNVTQAVKNLIQVLFPHVSEEQIELIVFAVFAIARSLRKALPDNIQTGKLGTVLKHLALEINPATQSNPTPPTPIQAEANKNKP